MSVFQNPKYLVAIQQYIKISHDIKCPSADLMQLFFQNVLIKGDLIFSENLHRAFENISKIGPGRHLMQRIISCGQVLNICQEQSSAAEEGNLFYQPGCKMYPNLHLMIFRFDETHFHITLNKKGERKFFIAPIEAILAHECLHFIHHLEKRPTSSSQLLIDPEFDNEEEQLTISGFALCPAESILTEGSAAFIVSDIAHNHFMLTDFCCENTFLHALGYPFRINHQGLSTGINEAINIIDVIQYNAIATLKKMLINFPKALHQLHAHSKLPKLSLLSAAAYYGHILCIDFLLSKKARIEMEDEMGGALMSAIKGGLAGKHHNWQRPIKLIDAGANVLIKDAEGKSALDLFKPSNQFCKLKKPVIVRLKELF